VQTADHFRLKMALIATKENCTLTITWPVSRCGALNRDMLKFIVLVEDAEHRMMTTPLSARSLVLRVAIPPYFSVSARLVVTVHLCHALVNETGWKTMESLTAWVVEGNSEEFAWLEQSDCEYGPVGKQ